MITIEPAQQNDYEQVCACDPLAPTSAVRRAEIAQALAAQTCYVAREHGLAVGYAIFDRSFFHQPFIALLMVHPQRRHEGIGTALMQYVEAHCPTNKLFTSTNQSNVVMQRLCEHLGFVRCGFIEHLDEGDPELIYYKPLPGHAASDQESGAKG